MALGLTQNFILIPAYDLRIGPMSIEQKLLLIKSDRTDLG